MAKKLALAGMVSLYSLYLFAIIKNNNIIGDLTSPMIMFMVSGCIFYGYVIQQKDSSKKWFGWFLTLAVFTWFLCDLVWGILTLLLHSDPENYFFTLYGYSMTNFFLFLAIAISSFQDLKKMDKMQALLDTLIVSLCIAVLLWLFVFEQKSGKIIILLSDPISMISLIIDIIIYAWINVWAFSTRILKPPVHHRMLITGGLLFVIIDFLYYYRYFYSDYEPNTWIDGVYVLAFTIMAISVYVKEKNKSASISENPKKLLNFKVGFDLLILLVPLVVFIFKRNQLPYFILLVVSLLIYYVLINYTQKSIFQEKLLELEKRNVLDLEIKIEERTEEIIKILNTDYVTGLFSRRYFESKLQEVNLTIKKEEKIALLYIDQNKSKAIKYLYGKSSAEILLKKVGDEIGKIASSNNGMLASYGDDVFVMMLRGYHVDKDAEKLAENIIRRCNELFFVESQAIRVTLNIGISCYPTDTANTNDLVKNADIAMMQARIRGCNKIQQYNDKIGNLTYSRHLLEVKLKKAAFDQEFQLKYQPQVYCQSGKLCGVEALIRWQEEGEIWISPLDFIPLAEEIGMIVPLGYWIMEHAAKQYAQWKKETGQEIRISVNVSSKQLVEVDVVQRLHELLVKYKIPPTMFEIEITESQQIESSISIMETLNEIKKIGISIAIDDFGTGYSSLYYIKNIPADRIKIAKELIDNIENDIYSNSIVQMAISIAKGNGMKVIAEGVETIEQLNCLRELGCDEIQGYYFSKAVTAADIERKWIAR